MYRVALNVAISFYRKEKKTSPVVALTDGHIEIEDNSSHSHEMEENLGLLQQFIKELKELDRALMLLYLEEKSYREIADIIGITETNVATKISRIKEKLKQQFSLVKK
jgi:RNA polymerase sigma factor (sigma-70 family)